MKHIYSSDYLCIQMQKGIMIQNWTENSLSPMLFKKELKVFLSYFKKLKPNGVLWIQSNFDLDIPEDLYHWIEKNILVPQYKAGLRKLAFTIPKAQYAHLSIIDSFNNVSSVLQPRYFISKEKAIHYLNNGDSIKTTKALTYTLKRSVDKNEILLEVDHKHLPRTIKHLEKLKTQFNFCENHKKEFDLLTLRELDVLKAICQGKQNKSIAEELFLSRATVATHRKRIISKLTVKSNKDWQSYADAFL